MRFGSFSTPDAIAALYGPNLARLRESPIGTHTIAGSPVPPSSWVHQPSRSVFTFRSTDVDCNVKGTSMAKYVAYVRVSTGKQASSGLGLEAQHAAIKAFLKPSDQLLHTYVEVESGKD